MNITDIEFFHGANLNHPNSIARLQIDFGDFPDFPRKDPEQLQNALFHQLSLAGLQQPISADLAKHLLSDTNPLAQLFCNLCLYLQMKTGYRLPQAIISSTSENNTCIILLAYLDPLLSKKTAELALLLIQSIYQNGEINISQISSNETVLTQVNEYLKLAQQLLPSITTQAIRVAAQNLHIPYICLDKWPWIDENDRSPTQSQEILQLNWGNRQILLQAGLLLSIGQQNFQAITNHSLRNQALNAVKIPTPVQDVQGSTPITERRAIRIAKRIGYPVNLRLLSGNLAHQSLSQIHDDQGMQIAYRYLSTFNLPLHIEKSVSGKLYQVLVFGEQIVAVNLLQPHQLSGNGKDSIQTLIEQINLRNDPHNLAIPVDDALKIKLQLLDLDLQTILASGRQIQLASNSCMGGTLIPIACENLPPHSKVKIIEAMEVFQCRAAVVEIISDNFLENPQAELKAISNINPFPDFSLFYQANEQLPLQVAHTYLDYLFPGKQQLALPIAAITGSNGKTTTSFMLAHILKHNGRQTGLANSEGIYMQGDLIQSGTYSGMMGALSCLHDKRIDCAVLESSRGTLLRKGLAFEHSNVACCLNIAEDHIGYDGVNSLAEMAQVKQAIVATASDMAVINGQDVHCLSMLDNLKSQYICIVLQYPETELLNKHLQAGHVALVLEKLADGSDMITYYQQDKQQPIIPATDIPATWNGAAAHNTENAMFAIAMAIGMHVPISVISNAMRCFGSSLSEIPGRLNCYNKLPFQVFIDYAHNAHGYQTLCQFVSKTNFAGKSIIILSAPADRLDEEIKLAGEAVAGHFDYYFCRDTTDHKHRPVEQVAELLQQGILRSGVKADRIKIALTDQEAILKTLAIAEPGDLLMIAAGNTYQETWDIIDNYAATLKKDATSPCE